MFGSTFGNLFKVTTWGESHGKGIGVVIDKKRYRQTAVHNFVLPTACYDDQTAVFSSAPNLLLYLQAKNKI